MDDPRFLALLIFLEGIFSMIAYWVGLRLGAQGERLRARREALEKTAAAPPSGQQTWIEHRRGSPHEAQIKRLKKSVRRSRAAAEAAHDELRRAAYWASQNRRYALSTELRNSASRIRSALDGPLQVAAADDLDAELQRAECRRASWALSWWWGEGYPKALRRMEEKNERD